MTKQIKQTNHLFMFLGKKLTRMPVVIEKEIYNRAFDWNVVSDQKQEASAHNSPFLSIEYTIRLTAKISNFSQSDLDALMGSLKEKIKPEDVASSIESSLEYPWDDVKYQFITNIIINNRAYKPLISQDTIAILLLNEKFKEHIEGVYDFFQAHYSAMLRPIVTENKTRISWAPNYFSQPYGALDSLMRKLKKDLTPYCTKDEIKLLLANIDPIVKEEDDDKLEELKDNLSRAVPYEAMGILSAYLPEIKKQALLMQNAFNTYLAAESEELRHPSASRCAIM